MAYINKEDVQAIRKELKATFPKCKFGVRKDHSSSVQVTLKQSPFSFNEDYIQVNQYWIDQHHPDHKSFFNKVIEIIKTAPIRGDGYNKNGWYDNIDAMTDYFDTAYYFNFNVGSWNQPHIQSS